ncbi:NEDD8-specific protease 1 [Camellia lanceoleosa]|uniref:NEDD8-specific protease 1 n=1 Tax=Camellia lanceoleosa TaxID=1840588 RepID=A0ACC0GY81_9ERIC|nr:NEDD8-specific protease 1 [Camellia lanceoleosa]
MGNEEVLTYKDIVLRRTDLDILEGPCYLNDQIIGFYFTYLSSLFTSQDVLLSLPSVSFWLANCQDVESAKDFVKPLKLSGKELEVFTVTIMMILV